MHTNTNANTTPGHVVLDLTQLDGTATDVAGGKGANLGELFLIDGIDVPAGFCVTTDVFSRVVASEAALGELLDRLAVLDGDERGDRDELRAISEATRAALEAAPIPDDVVAAITAAVVRHGEGDAFAVRSSATAEDLPTASFAGQQDTYLNVVGTAAILQHVSRCWGSLFTERAVTYRMRNGIDHRSVRMAVVVQRMVDAESAGVLFTADPVTSNRTVTTIEASVGLGEALVGGLVAADVFVVRNGEIVDRTVGEKRIAVRPVPGGGTREQTVEPDVRRLPALTDEQAVRLAGLGRSIEAHMGTPQDVEWCLVDGRFHIVQARPITTLFPVPVAGDDEPHVYVSVGHQQMMTDPMRPLGLSLFQLTALPVMHEAGGRLFVDVAPRLADPAMAEGLLAMLGTSDPLIGDALRKVVDRGDVLRGLPEEGAGARPPMPLFGSDQPPIETDPAIVTDLITRTQASIAAAVTAIEGRRGVAVVDGIVDDVAELKRMLFDPQSTQVIMAGMEATQWLNERMLTWLGVKNAADTLAQSAPHNVTSEMGLALLDVADAVRPYPAVIEFLGDVDVDVDHDRFLDGLQVVEGGREARAAIEGYLDAYGMRCAGEIDISRPRWSDRPATLVPAILGNVRNFGPGEGRRRFERGLIEAGTMERTLLERLRVLPDGESKAVETEQMIARLRTFVGFREYPKYGIVCRYAVYRRALMREADRLADAGVLGDPDDACFLTLAELRTAIDTGSVDPPLVRRRAAEFRSYQAMTPPRVMTSDGEIVTGVYRRDDLPDDVLIGLPVSTGVVEGRARVVLDMAAADLEPGDILVTAFTDPSWTPLFVSIAGLVTEVGGLMTHGAVVAREYGLPAVVGVERATQLLRDGQRIRVNGTDGYVEIVTDDAGSTSPTRG